MRADVTLTEAEYLAANRAHGMLLMTNGPGWLFPFAAAVWAWVIALFLRKPGLTGALLDLGFGIVLGVAIWLLLVFLTHVTMKGRTRHLFAQQRALTEPTAFSWDGAAFRSNSESTTTRVRWPDMVRWAETDRALLLFPNDLMFYVLPKPALTPETQASLIAELTANGVPRWRRWQGLRKPVRKVALDG